MADDVAKAADAGASADIKTDTKTDATIIGGAPDAAKTATGGAAVADTTKTDASAPDWRTKLAGEDASFRKTLDRYASEADFGKAHRALLARMSSGEFKKALPETATPEEKATWRKENGLPEKAEGYVESLSLPQGLVIGDADKPIVTELASAALESNVDPKAFNSLVAKYYAIQDAQAQEREKQDGEFRIKAEDELRGEMGQDYRRNLNAISNLLAGAPEGLAANLLAARDPEGRKLGDNPNMVRWLASLALDMNPTATLVPAGTSDPMKTATGRLEEIRQLRRDNPDKYESDRKLQAEELQLIEAVQKTNARGKAA